MFWKGILTVTGLQDEEKSQQLIEDEEHNEIANESFHCNLKVIMLVTVLII